MSPQSSTDSHRYRWCHYYVSRLSARQRACPRITKSLRTWYLRIQSRELHQTL